jgi:hypothetical protein
MTLPFHKPKRGPEKGLSLAVFGKHPGWDDHIEDLGIETEQLIALRQTFYVDGIGGNVETGRVGQDGRRQAIPFHHVVAGARLREGSSWGVLWASKDGKGRDKYPMVVFVQGFEVFSPAWMLDYACPGWSRWKAAARAALSAAEIRNIVSAERAELNERASDGGRLKRSRTGNNRLICRPIGGYARNSGRNAAGWKTILYKALPGSVLVRAGADASARRPQQLRVPRCADSLARARVCVGARRWRIIGCLPRRCPDAAGRGVLVGHFNRGPTVQQIHALQCAVRRCR